MHVDTLILGFDRALQTLFGAPRSVRPSPGTEVDEAQLSAAERAHAAALMRVNHVGEVCAQALYQGQSLACRDARIQDALQVAAREETEHLAWTEGRIRELGGRKSLLNPLWYAGSFGFGMLAGSLGNERNLGFLAETETQVGAHLDRHLAMLPAGDERSRSVVRQMQDDELAHAHTARRLGARAVPAPVRLAMRAVAGVMTRVAYYV